MNTVSRKNPLFLMLFFCLFFSSNLFATTVYETIDEKGNPSFTDRAPTKDKIEQTIKIEDQTPKQKAAAQKRLDTITKRNQELEKRLATKQAERAKAQQKQREAQARAEEKERFEQQVLEARQPRYIYTPAYFPRDRDRYRHRERHSPRISPYRTEKALHPKPTTRHRTPKTAPLTPLQPSRR